MNNKENCITATLTDFEKQQLKAKINQIDATNFVQKALNIIQTANTFSFL